MGFVEGVFCKVRHLIVNVVCHIFRNAVCKTAFNPLFLISVYEVLSLFFHDRLHELARLDGGYGLGLTIGIAGAVTWSVYGVAQKILLREFTPAGTLLVIYTCVAAGLTPFVQPDTLRHLTTAQWLCLAFCCLNTVVAYGCFSRAVAIWHTAGVGAVLSLTPLFTLACTRLAHALAPGFF
ncbi:MAG: EamA family transporter, partial [Lachnospiraceae bacterium]|nr:EamA family transporter [Lachnospiraceae bacterium]